MRLVKRLLLVLVALAVVAGGVGFLLPRTVRVERSASVRAPRTGGFASPPCGGFAFFRRV